MNRIFTLLMCLASSCAWADDVANIKKDCAIRWKGDPEIRQQCVIADRQALKSVREYLRHLRGDARQIVFDCIDDYMLIHGPQWHLVRACTEYGINAYNRENREEPKKSTGSISDYEGISERSLSPAFPGLTESVRMPPPEGVRGLMTK